MNYSIHVGVHPYDSKVPCQVSFLVLILSPLKLFFFSFCYIYGYKDHFRISHFVGLLNEGILWSWPTKLASLTENGDAMV